MKPSTQELAERLLRKRLDQLTVQEERVLGRIAERGHISRDVLAEHEGTLTFGQRLADRVAAFGGSWPFIILFLCIMLVWISLNAFILIRHDAAFDPYPFILLNLVLSMLAALQAPVIMMSGNRQAAKDRLDAAHDYEVNLKAELEIMALHEKIDALHQLLGELRGAAGESPGSQR
jgi:uncharacterized membrane protein